MSLIGLTLAKLGRFSLIAMPALGDIKIVSKTMQIKETPTVKHSWEEYKFPEVKPEPKKEAKTEEKNNAN